MKVLMRTKDGLHLFSGIKNYKKGTKQMKLQNFLIISLLYINTLQATIDNKNYEEIVVSASLMPISIGNSANAITIISAEEIESIAIASLSDLLRDVPGFAVSRSGVLGSQTQIRVRGSEANHVLVLIDGIEVINNKCCKFLIWPLT